MTLSKTLIVIIALLLSMELAALAADSAKEKPSPTSNDAIDPRTFLHAGLNVDIESYNEKTKLYHLVRSDMLEATDLYAEPLELKQAIRSLQKSDFLKKPKSLVGASYRLDKDLVLFDKETEPQKK